mmetsp:Transcript_3525/g.10285  ORF Transcript_3525/g.10285 Transcript_3525/m.10285 type:complete len:253 (-) Transcript_3525:43-801(-)
MRGQAPRVGTVAPLPAGRVVWPTVHWGFLATGVRRQRCLFLSLWCVCLYCVVRSCHQVLLELPCPRTKPNFRVYTWGFNKIHPNFFLEGFCDWKNNSAAICGTTAVARSNIHKHTLKHAIWRMTRRTEGGSERWSGLGTDFLSWVQLQPQSGFAAKPGGQFLSGYSAFAPVPTENIGSRDVGQVLAARRLSLAASRASQWHLRWISGEALCSHGRCAGLYDPEPPDRHCARRGRDRGAGKTDRSSVGDLCTH